MRRLIFAFSNIFAICVFSTAVVAESSNDPIQIQNSKSQLRSAFLGPSQWGNESLTADQIKAHLRDHFRVVLHILDEQTESSLDEAVARLESHYGLEFSQAEQHWVRGQLEEKRDSQIRTLRHYAARGRFPLNEGQSKDAIPIFVDDHGIHCAVGYLMHCSGHDNDIADIVAQNNFVYVNDVQRGAVIDWILFSGLTQAESALIQPGYQPPDFQATLADFQNPGFSLSMLGLTVTELTVLEYSYDGGDDFDQAFDMGVSQIFNLGQDYGQPNEFGIAIGEGIYVDPVDLVTFEPELNHWIFLGGESGPLGSPNPGDNSLMHWINYRVSAGPDQIEQFGLTSNVFFNSNFAELGGALRLTTQILTPDLMLESQGTIEAIGNDDFPFLHDSVFMSASGDEFFVSTFALAYSSPGFQNAATFTSMWNEIQVVPEPGSITITWALVGIALSGRRRRGCGSRRHI